MTGMEMQHERQRAALFNFIDSGDIGACMDNRDARLSGFDETVQELIETGVLTQPDDDGILSAFAEMATEEEAAYEGKVAGTVWPANDVTYRRADGALVVYDGDRVRITTAQAEVRATLDNIRETLESV